MNLISFYEHVRCGLWASSGPFPLSAHYGLSKRGRDPPPPQTLAVIWRKKGVLSLSSGCSRKAGEGVQPPSPPPPPPRRPPPLLALATGSSPLSLRRHRPQAAAAAAAPPSPPPPPSLVIFLPELPLPVAQPLHFRFMPQLPHNLLHLRRTTQPPFPSTLLPSISPPSSRHSADSLPFTPRIQPTLRFQLSRRISTKFTAFCFPCPDRLSKIVSENPTLEIPPRARAWSPLQRSNRPPPCALLKSTYHLANPTSTILFSARRRSQREDLDPVLTFPPRDVQGLDRARARHPHPLPHLLTALALFHAILLPSVRYALVSSSSSTRRGLFSVPDIADPAHFCRPFVRRTTISLVMTHRAPRPVG